jgi:hypothetical protein
MSGCDLARPVHPDVRREQELDHRRSHPVERPRLPADDPAGEQREHPAHQRFLDACRRRPHAGEFAARLEQAE